MLFTIIKIGLKGRALEKNPEKFAEGAVRETALSVLVLPVISAVLFLVLLFVLSFTHLLGGPYFLAKIFFFITIVGYAFLSIPAYIFYKTVKAISKKAGKVTEEIVVTARMKD